MGATKKYTDKIFRDVNNPYRKGLYGQLGLMFLLFQELAKKRLSMHMSQADLAKKLRLKQSYIAKIESGRSNPTLRILIKIADALDLSVKFEERKSNPVRDIREPRKEENRLEDENRLDV